MIGGIIKFSSIINVIDYPIHYLEPLSFLYPIV